MTSRSPLSVKTATLLLLTTLVSGCITPNDAYRGNDTRPTTTYPERENAKRLDNLEMLGIINGGILGGLMARGIGKLTEPKDPGTTPIAPIKPSQGKTEYLNPVADAPKKATVQASAKKETVKTNADGTVYLSE